VNVRNGLLRLWIVFAIVWIGAVGVSFLNATSTSQFMGWRSIDMDFEGYELQAPYGMSDADVSKMFDALQSRQLRTSPQNRFAKYKNGNADEARSLTLRQSQLSAVYRASEAKTREELRTEAKSSFAWAGFPFIVLAIGYVIGWIARGFRS
jgi:hypothetical protein